MYVVVQHAISDPASVWEVIRNAQIPAHLKLHQLLPNEDGTRSVCLWEADSVDNVRNFIEPAIGYGTSNTYFAVQTENALGLQRLIKA